MRIRTDGYGCTNCGTDFEAETVADAPVAVSVASVKALRCPRCDASSSRLTVYAERRVGPVPPASRAAVDTTVVADRAAFPSRPAKVFRCRWTAPAGTPGTAVARRVCAMRMLAVGPSDLIDDMPVPLPRTASELAEVLTGLGGLEGFWRDVDPEDEVVFLKRIFEDEGDAAFLPSSRTARALDVLWRPEKAAA